MSTTEFIAITAVVGTCGTNILVAYWHRKQIRQIEEFRRDPSLGLRPPPSRFWAFVKRHSLAIMGTVIPTYLLIFTLVHKEPITKWTIFVIAFCIGAIMLTLVLALFQRLLGVVEHIIDIQAVHVRVTEHALSITTEAEKNAK